MNGYRFIDHLGFWFQETRNGNGTRTRRYARRASKSDATEFATLDEARKCARYYRLVHGTGIGQWRLIGPKQPSSDTIQDGNGTDELTTAKARSSDPITSHEAAQSIRPTNLEQVVLDGLRLCGNGATSDELAEKMRMDRDSVSPRMRPLQKKGFVRLTDQTRVGKSGRRQVVWITTNQ